MNDHMRTNDGLLEGIKVKWTTTIQSSTIYSNKGLILTGVFIADDSAHILVLTLKDSLI